MPQIIKRYGAIYAPAGSFFCIFTAAKQSLSRNSKEVSDNSKPSGKSNSSCNRSSMEQGRDGFN